MFIKKMVKEDKIYHFVTQNNSTMTIMGINQSENGLKNTNIGDK